MATPYRPILGITFFFQVPTKHIMAIHQLLFKFPTMLVMFLVLCSAILAAKAEDGDGDSKDPWFGHKLPPAQPGYYQYLKNCIKILTQKCGLGMYSYIFNARLDIDMACCNNLIKMGETCSKALSYKLSHIEEFDCWRGHIYEKANTAFHVCLKKMRIDIAPAPYH